MEDGTTNINNGKKGGGGYLLRLSIKVFRGVRLGRISRLNEQVSLSLLWYFVWY